MALIPCWECGQESSTDAPSCPQCGALRGELLKAKRLGIRIVIAVIVFLIGVGSLPPKDQVSANAPRKNGATKAKEEANLGLRNNGTLLADSPLYSDTVRTLITAKGYECPRLANFWPKGSSPPGSKLEALCGPLGTIHVDPALHYSVYPDRLKVVLCKPFGIFAAGCE